MRLVRNVRQILQKFGIDGGGNHLEIEYCHPFPKSRSILHQVLIHAQFELLALQIAQSCGWADGNDHIFNVIGVIAPQVSHTQDGDPWGKGGLEPAFMGFALGLIEEGCGTKRPCQNRSLRCSKW
uniref:Uncharacterized protein n=1 Tax=Proboscia inermis TaxID=420281 RepID=A0A7S0C8J5_9STRA